MPYFYDVICLDFYKQKKIYLDFRIKDENFIGITKICAKNITAFYLKEQLFPISNIVDYY